jgi:FkbM family methyltransferase
MLPQAGLIASTLRERFHPLYRLRKYAFARAVLTRLDIPVWVRMPGVNWKVRVRLISHAAYYVRGAYPEMEIAAMLLAIDKLLAPRSYWCVGANIGYYGWLLKSSDPGLRVVMFEPNPANVHLIRATLRRSRLSDIVVQPSAVSDTVGIRPLAVDRQTGATSTLEGIETSFGRTHWGVVGDSVPVSTVTIDSARSEPIDVIKIDVEGHEENVLRGADKTLRSDQPILVVECFHEGACLAKTLKPLGYLALDAQRMDEDLTRGCNFLALPRRHRPLLGQLRKAWSAEVVRLRGA